MRNLLSSMAVPRDCSAAEGQLEARIELIKKLLSSCAVALNTPTTTAHPVNYCAQLLRLTIQLH